MTPVLLSFLMGISAYAPQQASSLPLYNQTAPETAIANELNAVRKERSTSAPQYENLPAPITEAPKGEKKLYSRDSWGFSGYGNRFFFNPIEGEPTHIIYGEDGVAYIYNPFARKNTNTYLKGEVSGDKITITLPQAIYAEEDWQNPGDTITYYIQLIDVEVDSDNAISYALADEKDVTFSINGDNLSLDLEYTPQPDENGISPYPSKVLAFTTADGTWANYGDCYQSYTIFKGATVEAPSNLSTEQWAMTWSDQGRFVNIGFDGDDVYLQGYEPSFPEAWIKGYRKDNVITFPSNQYLGEIPNYHYIIFYGAIANEAEDTLYLADSISFEYDPKNRTLTCAPDAAIVSNAAEDKIFWYAYYECPKFCLQPEDMSQVPPTPRFWGYLDFLIDYGYASFSFYLDPFTEEGYLLNTDNMTYEIEFDGVVETLTPEDYYMEETVSRIPYNMNQGSVTAQGAYHSFTLYSIGLESIGVRQYNTHDGKTYASSTMTYYPESGEVVTEIPQLASEKEIKSIRWFNISGVEETNPGHGLYLRLTEYADGTHDTHKVIVK